MTTGSSQNAILVQVPEGANLRVEFTGAGGQLTVNETGLVLPANDQNPSGGLAQRVLEVGQRLRDGTVVLSVDPDNNEAVFLPAEIFGGCAKFDNQNDVVASVNEATLHGHKDWCHITDDEGNKLADNWAKVTTKHPEWFWLTSSSNLSNGRVRYGRYSDWSATERFNFLPVPVVRSGSARSLDI